jgi:hypothetical protein
MCSFFQIRDFNLGPTILLPSETGTAEQVDKNEIEKDIITVTNVWPNVVVEWLTFQLRIL